MTPQSASARARWDKKRRCLECSRRIIHSEIARYCQTCARARDRARRAGRGEGRDYLPYREYETVAHVERLFALLERRAARAKWNPEGR